MSIQIHRFQKWKKKFGIKSVSHQVRRAVIKGIIPKENLDRAVERRMEIARKKPGKTSYAIGAELYALAMDYVYFDDTVKEIAERYGYKSGHCIPDVLKRAIGKGIITQTELEEGRHRKRVRAGKISSTFPKRPRGKNKTVRRGVRHTEQSRDLISQAAIQDKRGLRLAEQAKKRRYELGGQIYDSRDEAAVGQLLERYIPGFSQVRGETFQASGDTGKIFDFVFPDSIVEWHPIVVKREATREDNEAYMELMRNASPADKKLLKDWYSRELATEYWMGKQEALDQSEVYKGREVILARDLREFYDDVLSRYASDLPAFQQIKDEFQALRQKAKAIKPKSLDEALEEAA